MAQMEIRKRVANAILYTNGMLKIENVRFSYPHLSKPYAGKGEDGKQQTPEVRHRRHAAEEDPRCRQGSRG